MRLALLFSVVLTASTAVSDDHDYDYEYYDALVDDDTAPILRVEKANPHCDFLQRLGPVCNLTGVEGVSCFCFSGVGGVGSFKFTEVGGVGSF